MRGGGGGGEREREAGMQARKGRGRETGRWGTDGQTDGLRNGRVETEREAVREGGI